MKSKITLIEDRLSVYDKIAIGSIFFIICTLILLNALHTILSDDVLFAIRASVHFIPVCLLMIGLGVRPKRLKIDNRFYATSGIILSILLSLLAFISVTFNGASVYKLINACAIMAHLFNISIAIPILINNQSSLVLIKSLTRWYINFVSLVSICIFVVYLLGLSPFHRLGYPFTPGVFAFMCLVAMIGSQYLTKQRLTAFFLFILIFLSGSRSSLFLAIAFTIFYSLYRFSISKMISSIFGIAIIGVLVFTVLGSFIRPYLVEREDISAGRFYIWNESLEMIGDKPILGYGEEKKIEVQFNDEIRVTHNSFLDLTLRYGILFSSIAYLYWLVLGIGSVRRTFDDVSYTLSIFFIAVSLKSMITNTFWTNMGDGVTYFVMVCLIIGCLGSSHRKSSLNKA